MAISEKQFYLILKKNLNKRIKDMKAGFKKQGEPAPTIKKQLAEDLGMSSSCLSHVLGSNGTRRLSLFEFYRMCILLAIRPEELLPITAAMTETESSDTELRKMMNLDAVNEKYLSFSEKMLLMDFRLMTSSEKNCIFELMREFLNKNSTHY